MASKKKSTKKPSKKKAATNSIFDSERESLSDLLDGNTSLQEVVAVFTKRYGLNYLPSVSDIRVEIKSQRNFTIAALLYSKTNKKKSSLLMGLGCAKRNPIDQEDSLRGENIAIGRALIDLNLQVMLPSIMEKLSK